MTNLSEAAKPFLGAWSLVSYRAIAPDGAISHPFGENPIGQIAYTADGRMSACLMRRGRARFASNLRFDATPAEREAAYRDFMAYFGSFSVDPNTRTVHHHVEGATFPNWIGTDLVRSYQFEQNTLTLSLTRPDGTVHSLLWERC